MAKQSPEKIRLAILETDTPVEGVQKKFGHYTGLFTHLFEEARKSSPSPLPELTITRHHIVDDEVPRSPYPELDAIDAILITGSKHDSYADKPWINELIAFTQKCLDRNIRIVGICFGHQILARAIGLKTGKNDQGWETGVYECEVTKAGRDLFGVEKLVSEMSNLYSTLSVAVARLMPAWNRKNIHQMHTDIVLPSGSNSLPMEAQLLASTAKCSNQGMYLPKKFISVQGHPEFTGDIVSHILDIRHHSGAIDNETFEDGKSRSQKSHDGIKIAQTIVKFCVE